MGEGQVDVKTLPRSQDRTRLRPSQEGAKGGKGGKARTEKIKKKMPAPKKQRKREKAVVGFNSYYSGHEERSADLQKKKTLTKKPGKNRNPSRRSGWGKEPHRRSRLRSLRSARRIKSAVSRGGWISPRKKCAKKKRENDGTTKSPGDKKTLSCLQGLVGRLKLGGKGAIESKKNLLLGEKEEYGKGGEKFNKGLPPRRTKSTPWCKDPRILFLVGKEKGEGGRGRRSAY